MKDKKVQDSKDSESETAPDDTEENQKD